MDCCLQIARVPEHEGEQDPILESFHNSFRNEREKRVRTRMEKFSTSTMKCLFCIGGYWLPSSCCYLYLILLLLLSLFQLMYDLYIVLYCPNTDCRFLIDKVTKKSPSRAAQNAAYTLSSTGGFLSYTFMIATLYIAYKKKNALLPRKSIRDVEKGHLYFLVILAIILVVIWLATTSIFYYVVRDQMSFSSKFIILATGVGSQLVTQWTGIIACFVFAASSFALGEFHNREDLILILILNFPTQRITLIVKEHAP